MSLDYGKIKEAAKGYEKDMTKFLREIVKNPGETLTRNTWRSYTTST